MSTRQKLRPQQVGCFSHQEIVLPNQVKIRINLVVEKKQKFDFKRNINLALTSMFFMSPILHLWHCKIMPTATNRILGHKNTKFRFAITGMLLSQITLNPFLFCGFYIVSNLFRKFSLQGIRQGIQELKRKIALTLVASWRVWPIATTINLMFVPIQYRVLFSNCISFFWNIYLSYIKNKN